MRFNSPKVLSKWWEALRPRSPPTARWHQEATAVSRTFLHAVSARSEHEVSAGIADPIRVLVAHDRAAVRQEYRRVLLETDVSHDIAAFRELRGRSAQRARPSGTAALFGMRCFEVIECGHAEEAVVLARRAAEEHRPFAVAFIDAQGWAGDGVWAAARIRETDPAVEIALCADRPDLDLRDVGALVPPEEKVSYLRASTPSSDMRHTAIALASKWLAERRVVRLAYFDTLTQLPNREHFRNRLSSAIESARRQSRVLALLYLDLDKFKRVNDTFGHAAGDDLLGVVASRLRHSLRCEENARDSRGAIPRPGDLARLSGDEFAALLPTLSTTRDAAYVAQRLIQAVGKPVQVAQRSVAITPSVGIAIYPKDGSDATTLLRSADAAMYFAKRRNPGTFAFFDPTMTAAPPLLCEQSLK
jgi:diguanylate cyclase (GGDEF)-like protein